MLMMATTMMMLLLVIMMMMMTMKMMMMMMMLVIMKMVMMIMMTMMAVMRLMIMVMMMVVIRLILMLINRMTKTMVMMTPATYRSRVVAFRPQRATRTMTYLSCRVFMLKQPGLCNERRLCSIPSHRTPKLKHTFTFSGIPCSTSLLQSEALMVVVEGA